MKPVWLHDLRLAWRHPEIRREVLALTAWKAAFWVAVGLVLPLTLPLLALNALGLGLVKVTEWLHDLISNPMISLRNRRTPYYRPIREKLEAKGAMQWQINGLKKPFWDDNPRADGQ